MREVLDNKSKQYLFLFDIDGTLVRTGGAGKDSMELALKELFGLENALDSIPMMGRTDPLILKQALESNGIKWTLENEQKLKERYFKILNVEIKKPRDGKKLCPGISDMLKHLASLKNIYLGLLTGNYRKSAYIKIGDFNISGYFPFGAFADDSYNRNMLGYSAKDRFEKEYGFKIPAKQVFIIGDTPADIECARPYNFKSIAVATGIHSYEELKQNNPDYVFKDLTNCHEILQIIQ